MKKIKIKILLPLLLPLCFSSVLFADVAFQSQDDVDTKWNQVSPSNPGVFYGDFLFKSSQTIASGTTLKSNASGAWRTLTSTGTHRFFEISASNAVLTFDYMKFVGGQYNGDTGIGSNLGGGAIWSSGSGLTINGNFSFEKNTSSTSAGAVYVASGTANFGGGAVSFVQNSAGYGSGGAVYSGGSVIFGTSTFLTLQTNKASLDGGGVCAGSGSVKVEGGAYIDGNEAHGTSSINGNGGAIYAATDISFTGAGAAVTASSNTAYGNGGAFYALGNVSFAGGAVFDRNTLTTSASTTVFHNGGAIWAGGNVSFSSASAVIQLSKNVAVDNGGAIYSSSGSVTFAGSANMSGNYVTNKSGGAIWAFGNISFTNNNALLSISSNSCILTAGTGGDGGAFYSSSGVITVNSYVQAVGNSAKNGGVFYSNGVMIRDGGEFSGNKAIGGDGGAIYINGDGNHRISSMSALTRDLIFENNTSSGGSVGNDIFLTGDANLVFYSSGVAGDTVTCRSITLGSGISYKGSSTTVLKDGNGKLILNGGSYFYNFNFKAGMVQTGAAAVFHSTAAVFSAGTFFDMRNGNNSDKVLIDTFTCSGKIYYDINSNSGASDVIETKTAKMAGSVIKVGLSGTDASTKTYTIVTAGANQGSGQMTIDNTNVEGRTMTRVNSSITYDSGNSASWSKAYINVHINQLSAIVGLTGNQMQSALALDRDYGTATGDLFTIIDGLDREPSENAKKEALNDLSGHIYANALTLPGLNIVKDNVLSRLKRSYFLADQNDIKRDLWVQGFTANNTYKGDKNSPGDFKSSNSGFQAGFDTLKYDKQIFGITAGYAKTSASQNRDTVDIEGYSLGGYGSYFFDNNFEARFLLMGGRQNYSASRSIRYLGRKTAAEYDGYSMNVSAELDYERFLREDLYMRPFASVSGAYVMTNAFSESGLNAEGKQSAANLAVNSDSYSRADLNLGFQVNNGTQMRLKWYGEIKMDLLVAGRTGEFTAQYENTGNSLDVVGIENDIVNFVLGAGVLYDISKSFSAYANVSGAFSGTQTGYYGNIGVNYKFATTYNDFYERSR